MSEKTPNDPEVRYASWWQERLSRRKANIRMAKIGTGAVAAVGIGAYFLSDDDQEIENDSLEIQRKYGWNIGTDKNQLHFQDAVSIDSKNSNEWKQYIDASTLINLFQPVRQEYQPFFVPTLLQVLSQNSVQSIMTPVHSARMDTAFSRGLGMKDVLEKIEKPESVLIISDIPGVESVAFSAALSDCTEPILTFDNWPHPLGVVPSHETLAALLYYAAEIQEKKKNRPASGIPMLMVLDSMRLQPYEDEEDKFDNRYLGKLPTAENLLKLGVTRVLYCTPQEKQHELDDINDDVAEYREKGIDVSMLPLDRFSTTENPSTNENRHVYYYHGNPGMSWWFFYHYSYPTRTVLVPQSSLGYSSFGSRPSYAPVRRPTMFSSGSVGGSRGVGKMRPSGFGRVSTRVGSDGSFRGVRSRSGSFGRSGGRSGS